MSLPPDEERESRHERSGHAEPEPELPAPARLPAGQAEHGREEEELRRALRLDLNGGRRKDRCQRELEQPALGEPERAAQDEQRQVDRERQVGASAQHLPVQLGATATSRRHGQSTAGLIREASSLAAAASNATTSTPSSTSTMRRSIEPVRRSLSPSTIDHQSG